MACISIAEITSDKLALAGGTRYRSARRPELYNEIIGKAHHSDLKVVWLSHNKAK